jgi:hypothetical protein
MFDTYYVVPYDTMKHHPKHEARIIPQKVVPYANAEYSSSSSRSFVKVGGG